MSNKIFDKQKIVVMGLGLHGGGVAVVKYLVKNGASVVVTDLKTKKQLQDSLDKLKGLKVKYVLGKHNESDFKNADMIVQNPGVPRESKYLKIARKSLIPIENEASLFFKYCPGLIVGVTGTRGKSTTSSLVYEILKTENKTWLAGLPGQPMLDIIDKVGESDIVVLELSSWQLEILGEQKLSPDVAVVTNIFPDHLNRYKSMSAYISAKKNIFKFQNKNDFTVINFDNADSKKLASGVKAKLIKSSKKSNAKYFKYSNLLGDHNLNNLSLAISVASVFKIKQENIVKALKKFKGLPNRLELIRQKSGVGYYNDTTSTTPDATIAALKSFPKKKIILIAGGDTKKIPQQKYNDLAKEINSSCKALVLLEGEGSKQIIKNVKHKKVITKLKTMIEAVAVAEILAAKGDVVLLSPACASFNLFVNEFDRGDQFNRAVKEL